jgi:hypothetical protein
MPGDLEMIANLGANLKSLISLADSALLRFVGRDADKKDYQNDLVYRGKAQIDGPKHHLDQDLASLDTKVGPLLTHVSIMIAAIAVLVSSMNLGLIKKTIFYFEIGAYLSLAICCLRSLPSG